MRSKSPGAPSPAETSSAEAAGERIGAGLRARFRGTMGLLFPTEFELPGEKIHAPAAGCAGAGGKRPATRTIHRNASIRAAQSL